MSYSVIPSSVSVDNETIIKKPNGEIQKVDVQNLIIGDFEVDNGNWNLVVGTGDNVGRVEEGALGSLWSMNLYVERYNNSLVYFEADVDFTDYNNLSFYRKQLATVGNNRELVVTINGSVVSSAFVTGSTFNLVNVNVSSHTGVKTLRFSILPNTNGGGNYLIDKIALQKDVIGINDTISPNAGN